MWSTETTARRYENYNSTVSVINGATGRVTATIGVGVMAGAVAVDPSTHTAYVTNYDVNNVSVINQIGGAYQVTATIGVGWGPAGVGVDPSTHTAYVANQRDGTVSVINGAPNAVTAIIKVGVSAFPWRWTRRPTPSTWPTTARAATAARR